MPTSETRPGYERLQRPIFNEKGEVIGVEVIEVMTKEEFKRRYPQGQVNQKGKEKFCSICGKVHPEGNMPTYEEAITGVVLLSLLQQSDPENPRKQEEPQ